MLVGKKAPLFYAPAVVGGNEIQEKFSLEDYLGDKNILLFFYPKDFTFVCPTELLSLQFREEDFTARDTQVIACSADTQETHLSWLGTPIEKGGIKGVKYPIIADSDKTICMKYEVLGGEWALKENDDVEFKGLPYSYRGTFFIDKDGIIRHQSISDLPLGRNVQEILRIIDMWQHHRQYGDVCPANWNLGKQSIKPTTESVSEYLNQFYTGNVIKSCCKGNCNCSCAETKTNCCSSKYLEEEIDQI